MEKSGVAFRSNIWRRIYFMKRLPFGSCRALQHLDLNSCSKVKIISILGSCTALHKCWRNDSRCLDFLSVIFLGDGKTYPQIISIAEGQVTLCKVVMKTSEKEVNSE
jgi:hypothetical protein